MRVAVTGAGGFLGWHTRCALQARGIRCVPIDRVTFNDPTLLEAALAGVDVVIHTAGVNRDDDDVVRDQNLMLAQCLTSAVTQAGGQPAIVYANSIQSGNGSPFGDGKAAAAEHFSEWGRRTDAAVTDVRLPNLFGEHGRPHYNSVVATFCHELASGGTPKIVDDREIPLLHVQDAVETLIGAADVRTDGEIAPDGTLLCVSRILEILEGFRELYSAGEIPDVGDALNLALFNTYRSFCFPQHFPIRPPVRSDPRGSLFETLRGHGGEAQVFCSTTRPGGTRGQHFHLRKVERFVVLSGRGEIALRRLFDDAVVRFEVTGATPGIVDMPTMWAHSIQNTGDNDLLTMFWTNEIFDPARPDTYPEDV